MNRFLITLLTFVFYFATSIEMYAAQRTWNGSLSTSWTTAGNWTPSGAPGATDTATIVSATNNPVLTANTSLNRLTMSNGTIDLGGYTLTITQRIACNGGSINNGKFIVRGAVASFAGTTFGCKVEAIVAQLKLDGGVYSDSCYFEQTGGSTGNGQGGNVFNGPVTIRNSGTSSVQTAIAAADTFNHPLNVYNSGNLSSAIVFSNGNNTVFNGNISISNSGSGQIAFGSAAGSSTSTLASGKTIAATAGAFKRGGLVLNRFTQIGSTAQAITLDSVAFINISNSQISGALTITSPAIIFKLSTFNGNVEVTKTGLTTNNSDGGNTFNANLTINNTASNGSAIRMATSTGDTYNGNVTLNSSNAFIQMAYADTSILTGNCSINHVKATFNSGVGALKLSGTSSQSFSGSATYAFGKLIIDKTSNGITFSQPATIDTSLRFLKGFIFTDSVNSITLRASASVYGASDSGYVDGYVKKIGNSTFTFPVGDNGIYVPIGITAPSVNTDAFLATFIAGGQTIGTSKDVTIKFIDNCNYWKLYRTSGSSAVNVKLTWQGNGCPLVDSASVLVANWNGSTWKDLSRTTFTGNRTNGTITNSTAVSSFNQFTLGYNACQLNAFIIGNGDSLKAMNFYGSPSYTYLWSTSATTSYILGSLAGTTYTVTITDVSGCSDNASLRRIFQKVTAGTLVNEANNSYYATWGDYDNDNDLDLFHSLFFAAPNNTQGNNFLFQNTCNGGFSNVQNIPGGLVTDGLTGSFSKWLDYDNDGDNDLLAGPGFLYENLNDGSFISISNQITNLPIYSAPLRDAGFADYNNDGLLDAYFGHTKIYKNDGDKDFTEISISAFSVIANTDRCDAIAWADYDNDGYMDVLVTNSNNLVSNYLFHNNGDGTFTSNTSTSQLIEASQNTYGCAWGDIDNDKDLDLWLNNNASGDRLFINNGSGGFNLSTQVLTTDGSPKQAGAAWADFDNDGDLDLFVPTFSKNYLFYNDGNGTFIKDSIEVVTSDLSVESYSGSFADYDSDGDLDLFVPTGYGHPNDMFYTNMLNPLINANHNFIQLSCEGILSNKDAIGARIYIKAVINGNSTWQMREINGNSTRGGESGGLSSEVVHFGLSSASTIDSMIIKWPASATIQYFVNFPLNRHIRIVEGNSTIFDVEPCINDFELVNPATISGKIYRDVNSNCTFDSGTDIPITNRAVRLSAGNYYSFTDNSGNYEIDVPAGSYSINTTYQGGVWDLSSCQSTSTYSVTASTNTSYGSRDFSMTTSVPCEEVAIAHPTTIAVDNGCAPLFLEDACPGNSLGYCFTIENVTLIPTVSTPLYLIITFDPWIDLIGQGYITSGTGTLGTTTFPAINIAVIPITLLPAGSLTICIDARLSSSTPSSSILLPATANLSWSTTLATNLLVNGNFPTALSITPGTTSASYVLQCTGSSSPGRYCVNTQGVINSISGSWNSLPPISANNMMMVDGTCVNGADFYCQTITGLTTNQDYVFTIWHQNINTTLTNPPSRNPDISVRINGTLVGNTGQFVFRGLTPFQGWYTSSFRWCSGAATTASICLRTIVLDPFDPTRCRFLGGNDFTIDDLTFREGIAAQNSIYTIIDCPCDPNDNIVSPIGCGAFGNVLKNQELTYKVRFLNTGGSNAVNILVKDLLDSDLDPSTFKLVGSSHQISRLEISPDNIVTIKFDGINLEPDSMGFIKFTISPMTSLADGTEITTQALIYFDQNVVVATNITLNTLYDIAEPDAAFTFYHDCQSDSLHYDFEYSGLTADDATFYYTFEDGTPSTSSNQNVNNVLFDSPGYKIVSLTVSRHGCETIYVDSILIVDYTDGGDSILICHDNSEIYVSLELLANHLSHGDCVGECEELGQRLGVVNSYGIVPELLATLSPNPAKNEFKISCSGPFSMGDILDIKIFNYSGKLISDVRSSNILIYEDTWSFENVISCEYWEPGIYLVRISEGDRQKTLKLILLE